MTRISLAKAKKLGLDVPEEKKNKFGNEKTIVDGIKFDSKKEAGFYNDLKLMKLAGEIRDFELQPAFVLLEPEEDRVTGRGIIYRADFKIINNDGSIEIVDTKGYKTQVYKLKKKLLLAKYPDINFREE